MNRLLRLGMLVLLAPGCDLTSQERVGELNEDGVHLYQRGSYAYARQTFEAALAIHPGDANLIYNLARCDDALGRVASAEQLYRQCLQQRADHDECRHGLVVLLATHDRRPEADALVQDWLRREPGRASGYVEDAWLLARDGDLLGARGRLQQAVNAEPRNAHALAEMGRVFERLNYPDRAMVLYERSLESDPRQPDVFQQVSLLRSQGVTRPHPE